MPAAPIVQTGAVVLRERAVDVSPDKIGTSTFSDLIETMVVTMREAPGVGLAAPQIGVGLRVIVLEDREENVAALTDEERKLRGRVALPLTVFINPKLRVIGKRKVAFFEGCLSVSGYVALVERHHEVEVTGLDANGEPQTLRTRGWPARILQHEIDHIDGTLYIDRMLTRSFSTQDTATRVFKGKSVEDIRRTLGIR